MRLALSAKSIPQSAINRRVGVPTKPLRRDQPTPSATKMGSMSVFGKSRDRYKSTSARVGRKRICVKAIFTFVPPKSCVMPRGRLLSSSSVRLSTCRIGSATRRKRACASATRAAAESVSAAIRRTSSPRSLRAVGAANNDCSAALSAASGVASSRASCARAAAVACSIRSGKFSPPVVGTELPLPGPPVAPSALGNSNRKR